MKVIVSSGSSGTPLYLETMNSGYVDRYQLWIFRQPANAVNTPNACFMISSAFNGLMMNVRDVKTSPGTPVQVYTPTSGSNEQFCIY